MKLIINKLNWKIKSLSKIKLKKNYLIKDVFENPSTSIWILKKFYFFTASQWRFPVRHTLFLASEMFDLYFF